MDEGDEDFGEWEEPAYFTGEWEESAYFTGTCTCAHPEESHGYGTCGVDDCPCEAGWEE